MKKESVNVATGEQVFRRFRDKLDYKLESHNIEDGGQESVTVPDDSIPLKEMLERHTRGLPMSGKDPIFGELDSDFDDLDLEKVNQLDLFDRQEIAREYGRKIDEVIAMRNAEKKARDDAQAEAARLDRERTIIEEHEKRKVSRSKSRKYEDGKKSSSNSDDDE